MQPTWAPWLLIISAFLLSSRPSVHAQHKSLADLKIAAEAGDPKAQTELADRIGATAAEHEQWLRKAAQQGYEVAQGKLGNLLLMRTGIGRPDAEMAAVRKEGLLWSTHAARQGDKLGQANLAKIYLDGTLVQQDLVQAFKWGELASQAGPFSFAGGRGRTERDAATKDDSRTDRTGTKARC